MNLNSLMLFLHYIDIVMILIFWLTLKNFLSNSISTLKCCKIVPEFQMKMHLEVRKKNHTAVFKLSFCFRMVCCIFHAVKFIFNHFVILKKITVKWVGTNDLYYRT